MLRAKPKGIFSKKFRLSAGEADVGELRISQLREKAQAVIHDRQLSLYRDGVFKGPFVLESEGTRIAEALKPSVFRNAFEVRFGSVMCEFKKKGFFRASFELELDGRVIGRVERESIWRRTVRADIPDDWPDALQVFIVWLALVIWRREAAASSG